MSLFSIKNLIGRSCHWHLMSLESCVSHFLLQVFFCFFIYFIHYEIKYTTVSQKYNTQKECPNESKLWKCIDKCTTNNWLCFQRDCIHICPTMSLVLPVRSVLCLTQSVQSVQSGNMKPKEGTPHRRGRAQYQHMSGFKRRRIVGL